jgi:hypothetical protein
MGVTPLAKQFVDFPTEALAVSILSYYGGWAECRIRSTVIAVVHCDFLSMYPTVNTLMGLWDDLTAAEIKVDGATDEIRRPIGATPRYASAGRCFDPVRRLRRRTRLC